jgi:hypothetical protein
MPLAQCRIELQRQRQAARGGLRGLAHAHEVARIDRAEVVPAKHLGCGLRLRQPDRAQRDVGLSLDAALRVPLGFAVADQAKTCDRHVGRFSAG